MHYRSFAYNLGRGLIWPVILLPVLGKIIGAIIIVAVVLTLLAFIKS
jgi:predicted membrane-bound spermidine synthase